MAGSRLVPWIGTGFSGRSARRQASRAWIGPAVQAHLSQVARGGSGPRPAPGLIVLGAVVASGTAGVISTQPRALILALAASVVALGAYLAIRARGVLLGFLLLVAANAIPVLDLDTDKVSAPGGLPVGDVAILAIIGLLTERVVNGDVGPPQAAVGASCHRVGVRAGRMVVLHVGALDRGGGDLAAERGACSAGTSSTSRCSCPLPSRVWTARDLPGLSAVLIAGGLLTAIGQIGTVLGGGRLSFLIHVLFVKTEGALPRVYSTANDLVILLVPLGLGLILIGRTAGLRRAGIATAAIAGLAVVLMQTRAIYATVPAALLAVTVLLVARASPVGMALGQGARRVAAVSVVSIVALALIAPEIFTSSTFGQVTDRALSGVSDATQESGTVAYRQQLGETLLGRLGDNWPIGMGFLHPNDYYVAGVPSGSIRNPDLGVLEAIMPMGALGTLLLYLPPIALTWAVIRAPRLGALGRGVRMAGVRRSGLGPRRDRRLRDARHAVWSHRADIRRHRARRGARRPARAARASQLTAADVATPDRQLTPRCARSAEDAARRFGPCPRGSISRR